MHEMRFFEGFQTLYSAIFIFKNKRAYGTVKLT